jgi:hypothetical protein
MASRAPVFFRVAERIASAATIGRMSGWPRRLLITAIASIGIGLVVALGIPFAALQLVEQGREPARGVGLHVREGWFWDVATDSAFGLWWVNIERVQHRSTNPELTEPGIPAWAEPRGAAPVGAWRVGTLAVGWPWPLAARQWSESESDRLFVPHAEIDDDGFTIAKMATNYFAPSRSAQHRIVWWGLAADVALFASVALLALSPRVFSRPASAGGRSG